jgi:hypothetical protein
MIPEQHRAMDGIARAGNAFARGAARWLCLAASPTFALMAFATAMSGAPDMGCSMGEGASLLGGMVPMYLLMSAFHLAPWLNLIAKRSGQTSPGRP